MTNIISNSVGAIKNWWLFSINGLLLIALAALVYATPIRSYLSLSVLFSIFILINGISNTVFSVSNRKVYKDWVWLLATGCFEILFGILLLVYPGVTLATLPIFVALWLLFRGFHVIGFSLKLKEYGVSEWGWLLFIGILLSLVSIFIFLFPSSGPINVIYFTSTALFLLGIASITFSFQLRKVKTFANTKINELKQIIQSEIEELRKDIDIAINNHDYELQKRNVDKTISDYESRISNL